jgi:hypothetical protein
MKIICGKPDLEAQSMTTHYSSLSARERRVVDNTRREVRRTLDRAEELGPQAYHAALMLLESDLSAAEILETARKVPARVVGRNISYGGNGDLLDRGLEQAGRKAAERLL